MTNSASSQESENKREPFNDALDRLIDAEDPAQVVYGYLCRRAYHGITVTRHIALRDTVEAVEEVEISLETSRKALDSLRRHQELARADEPLTRGNISVGFIVDNSLPEGVLDPYEPDAELDQTQE